MDMHKIFRSLGVPDFRVSAGRAGNLIAQFQVCLAPRIVGHRVVYAITETDV